MDIQAELRLARERIDQLSKANAYLREQVRAERERFAPTRAFPINWRLTRTETVVLSALLSRDLVTRDNLMAAMYPPHVRDEIVPKIAEVYVCRLRGKLRPFGITIHTRHGMGWHIDPQVRARVKALVMEAA